MNADRWEILVIASLWAVAVGVLGLGVGWLLRTRSLRWQFGLVAVVAVSGVLAGVLAIAQRMFISDHDREVVVLVTLAAGVVALLVANALGVALVRWSRGLQDEVRRLGTSGASEGAPRGPSEFQALSAELAAATTRLAESRSPRGSARRLTP